MMARVVVVAVSGLQAVGLILIIALVIVPAAAARFWTERLWLMTLIAAGFGAVSGYVGAALSALLPRFPAGAVIVLVAGCLFLVSLLRSEEHTSELQSLMRNSYAVFCLKKKQTK